MPGDNHFEIFPERHTTGGDKTGNFLWRFQYSNGDLGPVSQQRYRDRTDANRGIHDFLSAINREHPHPPIIDVEV
jgi:uncharacterized protein YegP (UPF0339 family)